MKRLLPVLMGFVFLLLSSTEGWSLPPCPEDQKQRYHNCFGTETYPNGSRYVGEYKNGKRHGQGTYTYANGDKYVGEWNDGWRHGQGTYTSADGRVEEGIFENGKFLYAKKPSPTVTAKKSPTKRSSLPPCPGSPTTNHVVPYKWTYCFGTHTSPDGEKYVGEWKGGSRYGHGNYTHANGNDKERKCKRGISN